MDETTSPAGGGNGFWISMAVLAAFGALIGFGFAVAYFLV